MATAAAQNFRVVCLGGSAGGLQAYTEILRELPADTGMAFVVAPHRAIQHADVLPLLLSHSTSMPVTEVKEGMRLEPNRVFVMPPAMDMTITDDVFHLRAKQKPAGWPQTISIFLFSLAEALGPRAVAVILSGMDHDGSAALEAFKAAGGITFAQSDAAFESMPRSAVETGCIDFLMRPAEIAKALAELGGGDRRGGGGAKN